MEHTSNERKKREHERENFIWYHNDFHKFTINTKFNVFYLKCWLQVKRNHFQWECYHSKTPWNTKKKNNQSFFEKIVFLKTQHRQFNCVHESRICKYLELKERKASEEKWCPSKWSKVSAIHVIGCECVDVFSVPLFYVSIYWFCADFHT